MKIFQNNLTKCELDAKTFYKKAFENNVTKANLDSEYFNENMIGLMSFGKMLNFFTKINKTFSIYYQEGVDDESCKKIIYYAIDPTGLIYGFIYGPTKEFQEDSFRIHGDQNQYFGKGKNYLENHFKNICGLVENWNLQKTKIDLELFKERYLPLAYGKGQEFYVSLSNEAILKTDNHCVEIPIIKLLQTELNCDYPENLHVFFSNNSINFKFTTRTARFRKDPIHGKFKGKIRLQDLTIFDLEREENE